MRVDTLRQRRLSALLGDDWYVHAQSLRAIRVHPSTLSVWIRARETAREEVRA